MTYLDFAGGHPRQAVQLIDHRRQIGQIAFHDPATFDATVDMLRNEGPNIFWDGRRERLMFGLEPTGEAEA